MRETFVGFGRWVARRCLGPLSASPNRRWVDRCIAWLARHALRARADTRMLAGLEGTQLVGLVRAATTRAVILGRSVDGTSVKTLLSLVSTPEMCAATAAVLERHEDDAARSQVIYEAICLSSAEITRAQRATALMVAARTAEKLLRDQARQILTHCLTLAGQPTDPYQMQDLRLLERRTATAILEEHPALDEVVLNRLTPGTWSADLDVLAAALTARPRDRAQAIAALFRRWRPTPSDARRFAEEVDATRTTTTRPRHLVIGRDRWRVAVRRYGTRLCKLLLVPVGVGIATFAAWDRRWIDAPLHPTFGEALGSLAVIAAIHVVSAQLAATRLEGVVARYSTSSVSIAVSYWAAITMAVCTAMVHSTRVDEALSWGATVSAVIFTLGALTAAWSLVRQTDPARAARLFARNRMGFYLRSGVRLGRIQARATAFRQASAQLGFVTLVTEPTHMERRAPILSGRRGAHIPNIRRLRRLRSRAMWADGRLQLHVLGMLGLAISPGTEIGAILPDVNSTVPAKELRRAGRAFRMHSMRPIETAAEGAVLLVSVTARLARSGDQGGAGQVGHALEELLRVHIEAADRTREASRNAEFPPVAPALAGTLDALAAQIAESETRIDRTILCELLKRIVLLGGKNDAAVIIVANRLSSLDNALSPVEMASILRVIARACLSTDDHNGLMLVERETHKRITKETTNVEAFVGVAADIPAMAAWLDQPKAAGAWKRYWAQTRDLVTPPTCVRYACRVGAANLAAGSISVAIDVALDLRAARIDLGDFSTILTSPDHTSREAALAGFSGAYLGQDPDQALRQFVDFSIEAATAIGSD